MASRSTFVNEPRAKAYGIKQLDVKRHGRFKIGSMRWAKKIGWLFWDETWRKTLKLVIGWWAKSGRLRRPGEHLSGAFGHPIGAKEKCSKIRNQPIGISAKGIIIGTNIARHSVWL
jgi:hypothetical protein